MVMFGHIFSLWMLIDVFDEILSKNRDVGRDSVKDSTCNVNIVHFFIYLQMMILHL